MWAASERNAGGGVSKTNTSGDGSHPGVEAATAAWEVLLAMARAGPAMLARAVTSHPKPPNPSTKNDEFDKKRIIVRFPRRRPSVDPRGRTGRVDPRRFAFSYASFTFARRGASYDGPTRRERVRDAT
jgi:hypothetical protein